MTGQNGKKLEKEKTDPLDVENSSLTSISIESAPFDLFEWNGKAFTFWRYIPLLLLLWVIFILSVDEVVFGFAQSMWLGAFLLMNSIAIPLLGYMLFVFSLRNFVRDITIKSGECEITTGFGEKLRVSVCDMKVVRNRGRGLMGRFLSLFIPCARHHLCIFVRGGRCLGICGDVVFPGFIWKSFSEHVDYPSKYSWDACRTMFNEGGQFFWIFPAIGIGVMGLLVSFYPSSQTVSEEYLLGWLFFGLLFFSVCNVFALSWLGTSCIGALSIVGESVFIRNYFGVRSVFSLSEISHFREYQSVPLFYDQINIKAEITLSDGRTLFFSALNADIRRVLGSRKY